MTTLAYTVPTPGTDLNAIADPEMATALTAIKAWANGSIDAVNLSALLAQAAGVNQNAQIVKGVTINPGPGTRNTTSFGALTDAADQVTGLTVPTGGLIAVQFQAIWSNANQGSQAAIFIGANQLKVQASTGTRGPQVQAAAFASPPGVATNAPLFSFPGGLATVNSPGGAYSADVTTGQATGFLSTSNTTADAVSFEIGGVFIANFPNVAGGWCLIDNLAAGTYTVGVQYKAGTADTITASNRRLRAVALGFS